MSGDFRELLEISVRKAICFLRDSRNPNGLWGDFPLLRNESDGWVTGFTGTVMAGSGDQEAYKVAADVWDRFGALCFFDRNGGWAFNRWSPEDADSTTWGLRFAYQLGLRGKLRTEAAENFLRKHLTAEGGITTFILEEDLRKFLQVDTEYKISGWMSTHPCVTFAAATLPDFNSLLIPYILRNQQEDGSWKAYWWIDRVYSVALAVEALIINDPAVHRNAIDHAISWVLDGFDDRCFLISDTYPNGSPFATALALKAILAGDYSFQHTDKITGLTGWLVDHQKSDGSWESSALLQVPPPAMVHPVDPFDWHNRRGSEWGTVMADPNSVFTTATVLYSLVLLLKHYKS